MKRIAALLLVLVVAGCASTDTRSPEEVVAERAEARWAAIAELDFAAAYQFLSPGSRAVQTETGYAEQMRRSMVRWNGANVDSVECAEARCTVTLDVDITVIGALQGARRLNTSARAEETWVRSGGRWYFVPSA